MEDLQVLCFGITQSVNHPSHFYHNLHLQLLRPHHFAVSPKGKHPPFHLKQMVNPECQRQGAVRVVSQLLVRVPFLFTNNV